MFRGDDPSVRAVFADAFREARSLGHPRVGSEHLLLALAKTDGAIASVLARHGATAEAAREAVRTAAPHGAGMAADREALAPLGIELAPTLAPSEQPVGRPPLFPLGAARAQRRMTWPDPPLGADAQAAYESSLRLALARRERSHRAEHLALALVCLDPGVAWTLAAVGADRAAALAGLAEAFPGPGRRLVLETRIRRQQRQLVRRYQQRTGRAVVDRAALADLISWPPF
ncbi:hypothetical protein ABIA35_008710 [Catenulispora sp. MAP12-49]|uniref:Clp protease N-terminal domain-containing protein n=1 Tax=unclassified Catenulispora TaxID=414885 RepID=UPI00351719FF